MSDRIRANLSIASEDPQIITRAMETLNRAATGLALEGIEVFVSAGPDDLDTCTPGS